MLLFTEGPQLFTRYRQLSQRVRVRHKRILWLSDSPVHFLAFVLWEFKLCWLYLHIELYLKLRQKKHFLFLYCLFASTIRSIDLWMEIFCARNCWTLKQMLFPLSVFHTLGCVVISSVFFFFHSSLYEGSILTLWNRDCEIIMTTCEMETSVYHFAISTLQCSFLDAIKSLSYAFISWFAFIFVFSSTWSLSAFWKLAAELSLILLCLEHKCS